MAGNMEIEGEIKRGPGRPPIRRDEGFRAEMRPDTRSESVREAEEYARKLMETEVIRPDYVDDFYVDKSIIPDGWAYQWKASHIAGKENGYHILNLTRGGWRPVPASRHREMMPDGYEGPIEKNGQVLMEIPKIMVERAERRNSSEAHEALRNAEGMLYEAPPGTMTRDDAGLRNAGLNKVNRTLERPTSGQVEEK